MKSTMILAAALSVASTVYGHGLASTLSVSGGESYELYNPYKDPYMPEGERPARSSWTTPGNGPIEDVTSPAIACNANSKPGTAYATAEAGSEFSIKWDTWPVSHHGPVMTYMAACNGDCRTADPTTLNWFKIHHAGLSEDGVTWASDELIKNGLAASAVIPADIKAGKYLLRHELLALHSADKQNGAQFYPWCINMDITGGGSAVPKDTVKFPGAYKATDPGVLMNIWYPKPLVEKYIIPGPAPYTAGGASSPAPSSSAAASVSSKPAAGSSAPAATSAPAPTSDAAPTYGAPEVSSAPAESSADAGVPTELPAGTGTGNVGPTATGGAPGGNWGNYGPGPAQTMNPSVVPGPASTGGNGVVTATQVQTVIETAVITMTKTVAETKTVTVAPSVTKSNGQNVVCTPVGRYRRDFWSW